MKPVAASTAPLKNFLIFLLVIGASAIICFVTPLRARRMDLRPLTLKQRNKMKHLRSELNTRIQGSRDAIGAQFQREYMTEERDRVYLGKSKSVNNPNDEKLFRVRFHARIHSGLIGVRGIQKALNFWVMNVEFPTEDPGTCLKFRYEDQQKQVFDATFKEGCNRIYNMILHWMTSTRLSKIAIQDEYAIPVPHDLMDFFGIALSADNPAHAGLCFWKGSSRILNPNMKYVISQWKHIENTDVNNPYDTVEGEVLDHDLRPHKFSFQIWLKRNRLIIKEMRKFLDHQSRSFLIHRVVPVDGTEVDFAKVGEMMATEDSLDFIVGKNAKVKAITVGGFTISDKNDWESLIEVKFLPHETICMTMKVSTNNGPQYYYAQDNCAQLFVEVERIKRERWYISEYM